MAPEFPPSGSAGYGSYKNKREHGLSQTEFAALDTRVNSSEHLPVGLSDTLFCRYFTFLIWDTSWTTQCIKHESFANLTKRPRYLLVI